MPFTVTERSPHRDIMLWCEANSQDLAALGLGEYEPSVDYVGPNGSSWVKMIPRMLWPYGVDINEFAYVHDFWYAKGPSGESKKAGEYRYDADKGFRRSMLDAGEGLPWAVRWLYRRRVAKYFVAVRLGGSQYYNYGASTRD